MSTPLCAPRLSPPQESITLQNLDPADEKDEGAPASQDTDADFVKRRLSVAGGAQFDPDEEEEAPKPAEQPKSGGGFFGLVA